MSIETNDPGKQENVIADYANEMKELEMQSYETAVRKARNALFWTAGLFFFWEMVAMFRADGGFDPVVFIIALIESGIFVALALWTKKKPYTAVVCGLIAFIGIIALSAVVVGMLEGAEAALTAVISGFIVKIIILWALISALGDAKALQKAKEEKY